MGDLVRTNDNCVGCNRCIGVCSCAGANVAQLVNGENRIVVDPDRCIGCGACIAVCEHHAREYEDDTEEFFADLRSGQKISLLLAPAFKANYDSNYSKVLGQLKALGVNRILSISFGADITTWAYIKYIQEHNFLGGLSQPCPAVVFDHLMNYLENHPVSGVEAYTEEVEYGLGSIYPMPGGLKENVRWVLCDSEHTK